MFGSSLLARAVAKHRELRIPGVVPRQSKINNLNCQTDLTAAMGAKGIFLHCQTGKITPRLLLTRS
jgi:hypothetical protein